MNTITYDLKGDGNNSDSYYDDIAHLTDEVLSEAEILFRPIVRLFMHYVESNSIEKLRSEAEYMYEFISLGIYWRIYGNNALEINSPMAKLLVMLYYFRREHRSLKPYVDYIRGILGTLFLTSKKYCTNVSVPNTVDIKKLLMWLEATGEFKEEVKRLKTWYNYLTAFTVLDTRKYLKYLTDFSAWFELKGELVLNKYTSNVEEFQRTNLEEHKWKEDYFFCGRKKAEYHLSMFGAEIMNREFRQDFLQTSKKAVLLPACMRINNGLSCKARQNTLDFLCTGCNRDCRINRLTKLGKEKGFEVHIIPHSSSFTKWLEAWGANKGFGVVGVACPLNLITGGLEMKGLNIAAQCVLLDYCGCTNHWDKKGLATDLNTDELLRLVGTETIEIAQAV